MVAVLLWLFFCDRRLLLLLTSFSGFPFRINSLADSIQFILLSFWKLPLQDCHAMTNKKEIATLISIIFYVTNGTLGFGGLYPINLLCLFPRCYLLLNSLLCGSQSWWSLYSLRLPLALQGALFEARTLIFWILSLVTIFVNLVNKHFARGFIKFFVLFLVTF